MRLIDEWAISNPSDLPAWVPKHELTLEKNDNYIERVLLNRENQSFEATYSIVSTSKESSETVLTRPQFRKQ